MNKKITLLAAGLMMTAAANAQLTNGGLETWRNYTVSSVAMEAPNGWNGSDSVIGSFGPFIVGTVKKQIYKTADVHGGAAAASLVSKMYGGIANMVLPGVLTNANVSVDIASQSYVASGGTPISQRVTSATAWMKYVPKGTDTATFGVNAVIAGIGAGGKDSVVGSGTVRLTGSSVGSYMQYNVPVTYINGTVMPTHIQLAFLSGSVGTTGVDSSVLTVDDASIMLASGVSQSLFKANVVTVFPNPAVHTLFINTKADDELYFEVLSANGQLISGKKFAKEGEISLNDMSSGLYFFRVSNKHNELVQTGKFMVN